MGEDFSRVTPLSEESLSSVSSPKNKESSITSLVLQPTSSWKEDFRLSSAKSNSLSQCIMQELESDKDISVSESKWSTFHPSWLLNHLSHTSNLLQPQFSSPESQVESKERRAARRVVMNENDDASATPPLDTNEELNATDGNHAAKFLREQITILVRSWF